MPTTSIIIFRESLEMILILIPLIIYLKKANKQSLIKFVSGGALTGFIASVGIGTVLFQVLDSFPDNMKEFFFGFLALIISGLILYNLVIINKEKKSTDPNSFKDTAKPSTLFLLGFITVFRECLEIILFILPTLILSTFNFAIGTLIGLSLTAITGFIIYKSSLKININIIFILISLVLIYFGAFLFGEGLASFFPQYASIETLGALIYGIPVGLIYIKKLLKKYQNKLFKN